MMGIVGSITAFSWGLGPFVAGYLAKFGNSMGYIGAAGLFLLAFVLLKRELSYSKIGFEPGSSNE